MGTLTIRGGRRFRYWFIAARSGFTHCVLSFGGSQQGGGIALAYCAARCKRQSNRGSGDVVRHLGDEHSVVLAKREIAVFYFSAQFFNRGTHSFKAILRMRNELRHGFRCVADLVQKTRHCTTPFKVRRAVRGMTGKDAPVLWESQEDCEKYLLKELEKR